MPAPDYSVPPVPPLAGSSDPVLDVNASGLTAHSTFYPQYLKLTPALLGWLRYHFGSASRIEMADLKARVWTGALETSGIVIASLAEWTPTVAGKRPSLLVDRMPQEKDLAHMGIADQLQGGTPGRYYHYMAGSHVVHCVGGREGETELLAAEVWRELMRYRIVAAEALCLTRLLPTQIGKRVQLSDDYKETYSVPVEVRYSFAESWYVAPRDEAEVLAIRSVLTP